jgi:general secretion pathway protein E
MACRQAYVPTDEELIRLGVGLSGERPKLYRGVGCAACAQTGYRGRSGIYEFLVIDDEVRKLIGAKADSTTIQRAAVFKGMSTLRQEGAEKVLQGLTTTEEVVRVTQQEVET